MYYDISYRKTVETRDMNYVRFPDWNSAVEWLRENGGKMSSILILNFEGEMPKGKRGLKDG